MMSNDFVTMFQYLKKSNIHSQCCMTLLSCIYHLEWWTVVIHANLAFQSQCQPLFGVLLVFITLYGVYILKKSRLRSLMFKACSPPYSV